MVDDSVLSWILITIITYAVAIYILAKTFSKNERRRNDNYYY